MTDYASIDRPRGDLIAADRVKGTEVYNHAGEKLGSIDSIYIDKLSGEVAYVVMAFGGFLGIGEKFHPLPWDLLDYDTGVSGYRVDLDRNALEGAPSYDRDDVDQFDFDRDAAGIDRYYAPMARGSRSADYDNNESGYTGARDDMAESDRPKGFYSPEQQAARSSNDALRDNPGGSADAGFYSPEQQASRNQAADDRNAMTDDAGAGGREPVSGIPGSTSGWDDPQRR